MTADAVSGWLNIAVPLLVIVALALIYPGLANQRRVRGRRKVVVFTLFGIAFVCLTVNGVLIFG